MLMPAKNKLPLTGNHIASLLLKASVQALRAQALNTVGNRVCSERGTAIIHDLHDGRERPPQKAEMSK